MALIYSPPGELGSVAPDFKLLGVDGKRYALSDFTDARALVVVFMCNHCPYVQAVRPRINNLAKKFAGRGVKLVGINSNDSVKYPDDSYEAMKSDAREFGYVFPYLWDETQAVAKAYGAVCTPDFYVYHSEKPGGPPALAYRGRLDDNWKNESAVKLRDLEAALDGLLEGREVASPQHPSMGCSIKWK